MKYVVTSVKATAVAADRIVTLFVKPRGETDRTGAPQTPLWQVACSIAETFDGPTYRLADFEPTDEGFNEAIDARNALALLLADDSMDGHVFECEDGEWMALDREVYIAEVDEGD